jgi:poly(beta-D-mannuronate) lyase
MNKFKLLFVFAFYFLCAGCSGNNVEILVSNKDQLQSAISTAEAGQTISMRNGVWRDIEIVFQARGSEDGVITLKAETPGKVIISGRSNLVLAGEYLQVQDLVFKDGYSPTGSVISFQKDSKNLAYHSRVTGVVIDSFNKPDRFESDSWVMLFGQHNRFDHNHLVGKMNKGVTFAVRLNDEKSQQNFHRIDHNYFGPRPVLGSNGGETLRIGTSHYSLSDSNTIVENNIFDRCNGEVEIVSIKSGSNIIRNNLFLESAGTLTLRHGNGNIVEGNAFIGNGKDHTGGIRVINADHQIRNNYLENLTGTRFGGGFVVMNGVPNSPINRYHPVKNVIIENNTLVNVDNILLAAGADSERSQAPESTLFRGNLFVATRGDTLGVTAFDDISGIEFSGNGLSGNGLSGKALAIDLGTEPAETIRRGDLITDKAGEVGSSITRILDPSEVGVDWYPKGDLRARLDQGREQSVSVGYQSLEHAVAGAAPGDILTLLPGEYTVNRVLELASPLTIVGAGKGETVIRFTRNALFEIQDGGSLRLAALTIDGSASDDSAGNTVVRTSRFGMLNNYRLLLDGVDVKNLDVNHSYSFLRAAKSTMADEIRIRNSEFSNVSGDVLRLDSEQDDLGIFNADYLTIENTSMRSIGGRIAAVYRGGTDESTFGPHVSISASQFEGVGLGKRNEGQAALTLHGVQLLSLENNKFVETGGIAISASVGEPVYRLDNNRFGKIVPVVSYKGEPVDAKEYLVGE